MSEFMKDYDFGEFDIINKAMAEQMRATLKDVVSLFAENCNVTIVMKRGELCFVVESTHLGYGGSDNGSYGHESGEFELYIPLAGTAGISDGAIKPLKALIDSIEAM